MAQVSVVLPTFNRAHTLARALDSVFAQTRAPDEVLVVDDGSTDDTAAIVARFPQARLLRLPENGGAARARNHGVRAARSEWIAFLDSDDAWAPRRLEAQLAHLAARPDLRLLCAGIEVHYRNGRVASSHGGRDHDGPWSMDDFLDYPFSPSTWLARADALRQAGGFDERLANCEDVDLLVRLTGDGNGGIAVLPEVLVTKHNLADSLDANTSRRAASLALLESRHGQRWSSTSVARTWQKLALMHFEAGDTGGGRSALLRALRRQPARPTLWGLLLLSLAGARPYLAVRRALGRDPR